MITGSLGKSGFWQMALREAIFGKMFSQCWSRFAHCLFDNALVDLGTAQDRMFVALAAYGAYVVNAGQFC